MAQILLLVICIATGFLLRRSSIFVKEAPLVLNNLIVYFFIPVLTLYHVPPIDFQPHFIWLSITPFLVYAAGFIFIQAAKKIINIDWQSEGALIMCSGIGSTSFVGFPIFEILYGEEGLAYGIVMSLAGTIFVFNTLGVGTGLYYSGASRGYKAFLKRLLTFPPLLSFILALMIKLSGWIYPDWLAEILLRLSSPFSVLALIAIGMQIDFELDKSFFRYLLIGQSYKMLLAPLLIYAFMYGLLRQEDLVARICVLGAAIGSMNSVSIVAAQLGLNPKLASLMPALSIPLSIPILFFVDWLIPFP